MYALVTDAGFARHEEVVWERLADVNGADSSFHAGNFLPVGGPGHGTATSRHPRSATPPPPRPLRPGSQEGPAGGENAPTEGSGHTGEHDIDADLALALSLQEEEERNAGRRNQGRPESMVAAAEGRGKGAPPLPPREGELPPPYGALGGSPSVGRRPAGRVPNQPTTAGAGAGGNANAQTPTSGHGHGHRKNKKSCVVM